jgi:hypothetical protein
MDLQSLIVPSKEVTVEYPGFEGFEVVLAYLTRDELMKLRKKATTTKLNRKTRQMDEEVDSDLFQEIYIKAVLKQWTGFKFKYAAKLLPITLPSNQDMEEELEFSTNNAVALMRNSPDFDNWVTEVLDDVQNFTLTK